MKISPLELRSVPFKKSLRGYDTREVDSFKELAASTLEDAFKEISGLEERLRESALSLGHHTENEKTLKDAITTAQRIMDDIRANAKKEA
ncbi:DivIVA domain-containing protein, partial [bacterium]